MQPHRTATEDVADLLGMTTRDVRQAVAAMKDDGEIDPALLLPSASAPFDVDDMIRGMEAR